MKSYCFILPLITALAWPASLRSDSTNQAAVTAPPVAWTTKDGKVYHGVKILRIEVYKVTISYDGGNALIDMSTLPPDIQKQLHYDPFQAKARKMAEAEDQRRLAMDTPVNRPRLQFLERDIALTDMTIAQNDMLFGSPSATPGNATGQAGTNSAPLGAQAYRRFDRDGSQTNLSESPEVFEAARKQWPSDRAAMVKRRDSEQIELHALMSK